MGVKTARDEKARANLEVGRVGSEGGPFSGPRGMKQLPPFLYATLFFLEFRSHGPGVTAALLQGADPAHRDCGAQQVKGSGQSRQGQQPRADAVSSRGGPHGGGGRAGEVVVPVPSPRHVKVGESLQCSLRPAWSCRDGVLHVLFGLGSGRRGPSVAAFHRGGDAEAALPAAGAPDDGTLLGELGTQIRTLCRLFLCPCPPGTC